MREPKHGQGGRTISSALLGYQALTSPCRREGRAELGVESSHRFGRLAIVPRGQSS